MFLSYPSGYATTVKTVPANFQDRPSDVWIPKFRSYWIRGSGIGSAVDISFAEQEKLVDQFRLITSFFFLMTLLITDWAATRAQILRHFGTVSRKVLFSQVGAKSKDSRISSSEVLMTHSSRAPTRGACSEHIHIKSAQFLNGDILLNSSKDPSSLSS